MKFVYWIALFYAIAVTGIVYSGVRRVQKQYICPLKSQGCDCGRICTKDFNCGKAGK